MEIPRTSINYQCLTNRKKFIYSATFWVPDSVGLWVLSNQEPFLMHLCLPRPSTENNVRIIFKYILLPLFRLLLSTLPILSHLILVIILLSLFIDEETKPRSPIIYQRNYTYYMVELRFEHRSFYFETLTPNNYTIMPKRKELEGQKERHKSLPLLSIPKARACCYLENVTSSHISS